MTYRTLIRRQRLPMRTILAFAGIVNLSAFLLAVQPLPQKLFAMDDQPSKEPQISSLPPDIPGLQATVASQIDTIDNTLALLQQSLTPANSYAIPPQFQGQTLSKVELQSGEKVVALTFDDGPMPDTPKVLDILKKNDVKGTFFIVGSHMQNYPDMMKRVVKEGHAVGNHTWHHEYHAVNNETAAAELGRTAELLKELTGVETRLFRPPGGILTNGLANYAASNNYAVVMWSLDSFDYASSSSAIADRVISMAHSGAIVLLHDGGGNRSNTVQALPQILQVLKQQGYRFVTLPELFRMKAGENQKTPIEGSQ